MSDESENASHDTSYLYKASYKISASRDIWLLRFYVTKRWDGMTELRNDGLRVRQYTPPLLLSGGIINVKLKSF